MKAWETAMGMRGYAGSAAEKGARKESLTVTDENGLRLQVNQGEHMKTMIDTNGNPLIPGHVYAAMTFAYSVLNNGELNDTGIFVVYGSDGKLYDCDIDEPTEIHSDCFDALVEQSGSYVHDYAVLGSAFYAGERAKGMEV